MSQDHHEDHIDKDQVAADKEWAQIALSNFTDDPVSHAIIIAAITSKMKGSASFVEALGDHNKLARKAANKGFHYCP